MQFSARPRLPSAALPILEQGALGVGSFLFSLSVTRTGSLEEVGRFGLLWATAWGAFAVLSEAFTTPARVAANSDKTTIPNYERAQGFLLRLSLATAVLALVSALLGSVPSWISVGLAGIGLVVSTTAFYALRGLLQVHGDGRTSLGLSLSPCILSGALVTATEWVHPHWPAVVALASASYSIPAAIAGRRFLALGGGARALLGQLSSSWLFGLATAIRVLLYSVVLLALLTTLRGHGDAAVFTTSFMLLAPIQLASSAMPWAMLPRLAARSETDVAYVHEARIQLGLYLVLAGGASALLLAFWGPWMGLLISDPNLAEKLSDARPSIIILLTSLLVGSWASSYWQASMRGRAQLIATCAGGAVAVTALCLQIPATLVAALPYSMFVLLAIGHLTFVARPHHRHTRKGWRQHD